MKTFRLIKIVCLLTVAFGVAHAQGYDELLAVSPDHPTTWVDGATRVHQSLRWSHEKKMLYGDVTYSTADYADNTHPTESNDFSLAFPTVHYDASSGKLMAGGTVIGSLQHGLFGESVALAPNVELSIHRHHGVIWGKLLVGNDE